MKAIRLKKEVFGIDEPSVLATVAYGFDNKKEATTAIAEYSGVHPDDVDARRVRMMKFKKKDGELYYFWGKVCGGCGQKNCGVISYVWDN